MSGPWEKYQAKPEAKPWERFAAPEAEEAPVVEAPVAPMSRLEKIGMGAADPIHGGAQLLTQMLPDGVVSAGNRFNNWLADKTGLVARLPEGGVDQQVREREAAYQQQRTAAGESGFDGYRTLGAVVSPANAAIAARLPAAASLLGRVGIGAAGGGASASLAPVTQGDDFWSEKGTQVLTGAAFGGATPLATGGVARVINPRASVNPQIQALRAEGVRPTIGQTLGGTANRVEEKLTSVPLLGDSIANARRGAAEDLQRAAFNRALAPVGQRLPAGLTGRDAVQHVDDVLSAGYNRLLPQLRAQADQPFDAAIGNVRQMVQTGAISPNARTAFERILNDDVLSKFQGANRAMTGETLKRVESDLGQQISRLSASTDADQRLVSDALRQVQSELRDMLVRVNPAQAPQLRALNAGWANFKRVQRASSALGADDGAFGPAQLQNAVKALDRSKDKARFAEGGALMQDLSDAGKSVLGSKVPDSGTPGRLALGGLSFLDPSGVAPWLIGGGAAAYLRPVQNALTYSVTQRPQLAQPVADALRRASPGLIPLGSQVGLGLLN